MNGLYTKGGVPLKVSGDKVFNPSGQQFGRIKGAKVFGSDGGYVGTIVGDRLVYRSTDSATVSSPFVPSVSVPSPAVRHVGAAIWGDEPNINARK
jgi:hypothetical protein